MNLRSSQDEPLNARPAKPPSAAPGPYVSVVDAAGIHGVALCDVLARAGFVCRLLRGDAEIPPSAATVAVVDAPGAAVSKLRACVGPEAPIVAVLRDSSPYAYAQAIDAGADGVLGCDCTPADLIHAVRAAAANRVLLPADVARELAHSYPGHPVVLSETELRWLRAMNEGAALAVIAASDGCPTSEVARDLRRLYARLRVSGRVEALERLTTLGMLPR